MVGGWRRQVGGVQVEVSGLEFHMTALVLLKLYIKKGMIIQAYKELCLDASV